MHGWTDVPTSMMKFIRRCIYLPTYTPTKAAADGSQSSKTDNHRERTRRTLIGHSRYQRDLVSVLWRKWRHQALMMMMTDDDDDDGKAVAVDDDVVLLFDGRYVGR